MFRYSPSRHGLPRIPLKPHSYREPVLGKRHGSTLYNRRQSMVYRVLAAAVQKTVAKCPGPQPLPALPLLAPQPLRHTVRPRNCPDGLWLRRRAVAAHGAASDLDMRWLAGAAPFLPLGLRAVRKVEVPIHRRLADRDAVPVNSDVNTRCLIQTREGWSTRLRQPKRSTRHKYQNSENLTLPSHRSALQRSGFHSDTAAHVGGVCLTWTLL